MANCAEMKKGDLFTCKICGLVLQVVKTCSCTAGKEVSCTVVNRHSNLTHYRRPKLTHPQEGYGSHPSPKVDWGVAIEPV